jgi:L-ribulose-5-phosphate 3-epimerase
VPISESMSASMRLVDAVRSPWFQMYPDMANLVGGGYHPPHELRLAKDHIVAVHVKDGMRNNIRGVPFGEGHVPFAETFTALQECCFHGPLVVEMWGHLDRTGDPLGSARAARTFVRPYQEVLDATGTTT